MTVQELYKLDADPSEKNNLAKQHPQQVEQLESLLNSYAKESKGALFLKEYIPFLMEDGKSAATPFVYDGDEDSWQADEKPVLPL